MLKVCLAEYILWCYWLNVTMTLAILIPTHKKLPMKETLVIWKGDINKALILYFSDASEVI